MSPSLVLHFADEKATFARRRVSGHTSLSINEIFFALWANSLECQCQTLFSCHVHLAKFLFAQFRADYFMICNLAVYPVITLSTLTFHQLDMESYIHQVFQPWFNLMSTIRVFILSLWILPACPTFQCYHLEDGYCFTLVNLKPKKNQLDSIPHIGPTSKVILISINWYCMKMNNVVIREKASHLGECSRSVVHYRTIVIGCTMVGNCFTSILDKIVYSTLLNVLFHDFNIRISKEINKILASFACILYVCMYTLF